MRCAVYTRKSTDEGLDRDFNTLDAQREAGEAYVASQKDQGWVALPKRYDDGGFTGGNMERPALQQLFEDIEAGRVDCVIVYKVDRLSRSLLDFARIVEIFDRHNVSFVAVTQEFNTATSMGRLMLNVLLSFAQFERELISERTRDKMGAARRKGKWLGSSPVLGYDVDREASKLVINPEEAERVRAIFAIYEELRALLPTVRELRQRHWHNKQWTTRKGHLRGGRPFNKGTLHFLLTNVTYRGQVKYRGEIYAGEQDAIVPQELFERVQTLLKQNRQSRSRKGRRFTGILQGKLYCAGCNSLMTHTYTSKGSRRYRYYVCSQAQKQGYDQCVTRSVPAAEIERYVLKQLQDQSGPRLPEGMHTHELIERVDYDGQLGDLAIRWEALRGEDPVETSGTQDRGHE
jgi:site-specific DNA recombinase